MATTARRSETVADVMYVGALVAIAVVVAYGVSYAFDPVRAGAPSALIELAAAYGALTIAAILYGLRAGVLWRWITPRWGDPTRGFFCALFLFVCAFFFVKFFIPQGSPRAAWMARLYLQLGDTKPLRAHQGWVGAGIFVMAAFEEIVWRGWVTTLLERLVTLRFAWIASAFLYALAHVPTLWALADTDVGKNPMVVIAALGAGLIWSGMARIFGRLGPSIICHALFDWAVLMMFRLWGPSV